MSDRDARRALTRLRRAMEKAALELESVAGALRHAEAEDFPAGEFADVAGHLDAITQFIAEQELRLQEKMLHAGGIEPGRVRRSL